MPRSDDYELHPRHLALREADAPLPPDYFDWDDDDRASDHASHPEDRLLIHEDDRKHRPPPTRPPWWLRFFLPSSSPSPPPRKRALPSLRRRLRWIRRCVSRTFAALAIVVATAIVFTAIFRPSYTRIQYPESWLPLEAAVRDGGGYNPPGFWQNGGEKRTQDGRGNLKNETVFIAANIINAALISGEWGDQVMELMDMLGQDNVFLSIFENDSGPETTEALHTLSSRISKRLPRAGQSILSTTLPLSGVPRIKLPNNDTYVKRITYLAEVRNRALLPLVGSIPSLAHWNQSARAPATLTPVPLGPHQILPPIPEEDWAQAPAMPTSWVADPAAVSRIIFLNDVVFDPVEVLHLTFNTNGGAYAAACGLDYINPFKFYDTFATRDADGFPTGVPFFPYFTAGASRSAILAGTDVPVKSCWGGVVSFSAVPFLRNYNNSTSSSTSSGGGSGESVLFRATGEQFWDASECCLVHADIDQPNATFVNPFVRSAYSANTFRWLPAVRLVERLFELPHRILAAVLGMPWPGPRRAENPGDRVNDLQWTGDSWVARDRVAGRGGFCGNWKLLVMTEKADGKEKGKRGWRGLHIPQLPAQE